MRIFYLSPSYLPDAGQLFFCPIRFFLTGKYFYLFLSRYFYLFFKNILIFFCVCGKNDLPVEPVMFKWRKSGLAGRKRVRRKYSDPRGGSLCGIGISDDKLEKK
jgi:hypothetical protein